MKRLKPFLYSALFAFGIALYSKKSAYNISNLNKLKWKTFEKKSSREITAHQTTPLEMEEAKIPVPAREIAQVKDAASSTPLPTDRAYHMREGRILLGDFEKEKYIDESLELSMINKINPDWKEVLGHDLLRFQQNDTKVIIKEEFPIIRIRNGKGQYLEQVIITYTFKNGSLSSYHALIDSDSGFVVETWDRTIHENTRPEHAEITLPEINNSGIIAK